MSKPLPARKRAKKEALQNLDDSSEWWIWAPENHSSLRRCLVTYVEAPEPKDLVNFADLLKFMEVDFERLESGLVPESSWAHSYENLGADCKPGHMRWEKLAELVGKAIHLMYFFQDDSDREASFKFPSEVPSGSKLWVYHPDSKGVDPVEPVKC